MNVEVRYLHLEWADQQRLCKFEAGEPLEVSQDGEGWCLESTVFNGYYPRLGFRILDDVILHAPYFIDSQSQREEMLAVVDPASEGTWWIQNSGWDATTCRYNSELQRTVGRAEVVIQAQPLGILNHSSNFTVEDLERCLADFKDDLWMLLFNENGSVKGTSKKTGAPAQAKEIIEILRSFATAVEKIVAMPVLTLQESIAHTPIRSVRPIPRTFAEMASKGPSRKLSSRSFLESMNTPENQYVHWALQRVMHMVERLGCAAARGCAGYKQHADTENSKADKYLRQTVKEIDESVFRSELAWLEKREAAILDAASDTSESEFDVLRDPAPSGVCKFEYLHDVVLSVDKRYGGAKTQFFCNYYQGYDFKGRHGTYLVVQFPRGTADAIFAFGRPGQQFKISGKSFKSEQWTNSTSPDKPTKKYWLLEFRRIDELDLEGETPARTRRSKMAALAANGWRATLTTKEKDELAVEADRSRARAAMFAQQAEYLEEVSCEANELRSKLSRLGSVFSRRGVRTRSEFPNSMVFVRNPYYLACKVEFDRLMETMDVGEDVFDAMQKVDTIGLLHVSSLYEKWCLLQIFKVLWERLGFAPAGDWKGRLVESALAKQHDTTFEFVCRHTERRAILTYEKVLANGRRPDFVLDITSPAYKYSQRFDTDDETDGWRRAGVKSTRLVMDAKFREDWRGSELDNLVEELRTVKGYSGESNDKVFVLHPCASSVRERTSPLPWGRHSDYGQVSDHTHGAIFLGPGAAHEQAVDGLHRLLVMVLQGEFNFLSYGPGKGFLSDAVCIGCGARSGSGQVRVMRGKTQKGNDTWDVFCESCRLRSLKTCCYECGHDLYKNGFQWTYHKTLAEEISNVVCPNPECHAFF